MLFLQCFGVVVFRNNTYVDIVIEYSRNTFIQFLALHNL